MLLSIKWIGNEGSHTAHGNFTREELFHASEVLEFVLEETYLDRKAKLLEKAKEINAKFSISKP